MAEQEDPLWVKAKEIGKQKSSATDWPYILSLYSYLGGNRVGIMVTVNDTPARLVGVYTNELSLVYKNNTLVTLPAEVVTRSKKQFIETDDSKILFSGLVNGTFDDDDKSINMSILKGKPIVIYDEVVNSA